MFILITIVHVIVCVGLILVVLLQTGKGADMGAVFGGSSATIFGSSGAGNFLTRLTTGMAIVFMITSILLGYFSGKRPSASVFDTGKPRVEQPVRREASPPGQPQAGPTMPSQPTAPQLPAPEPQKAEGGTGSRKYKGKSKKGKGLGADIFTFYFCLCLKIIARMAELADALV